MKRNGVSSICRSKPPRGGAPDAAWGLFRWPHQPSSEREARWTTQHGAGAGRGDPQQPRIAAEGKKTAKGPPAPIKMLKMKVDPEMYMKTKNHATTCPTQKTTFVPGCTPFYTKSHLFCRNRRLICHNLRAGERTGRFKMWKLEKPVI